MCFLVLGQIESISRSVETDGTALICSVGSVGSCVRCCCLSYCVRRTLVAGVYYPLQHLVVQSKMHQLHQAHQEELSLSGLHEQVIQSVRTCCATTPKNLSFRPVPSLEGSFGVSTGTTPATCIFVCPIYELLSNTGSRELSVRGRAEVRFGTCADHIDFECMHQHLTLLPQRRPLRVLPEPGCTAKYDQYLGVLESGVLAGNLMTHLKWDSLSFVI